VSKGTFDNEDWQLADRAAAFLGVDRDVCRKAFHREPAHRVRAVVQRVLSERQLPGYDPEQAIEEWARERGAGVYGARRRSGDLERGGGIVMRAVFGRDAVA
jgi:hypothetical protein